MEVIKKNSSVITYADEVSATNIEAEELECNKSIGKILSESVGQDMDMSVMEKETYSNVVFYNKSISEETDSPELSSNVLNIANKPVVSNNDSEYSSQQEHHPIKRRTKHRRLLINDESDSDDNSRTDLDSEDSQLIDEDESTSGNMKSARTKKNKPIIDSDSDNDNDVASSENKACNNGETSMPKIIDSDSDDNNYTVSPHNKSSREHKVGSENSEIYITNSKGELVLENSGTVQQKSKWSSLCDVDSSEEENYENNCPSNIEETTLEEENIKPIKYKRKTKQGEKESKRMTSKEAAKLKKEITSESQRMVRESNVSLPYHKPKVFTLKEFLSRRPKLASAVPIIANTSPSVAIKMCEEKLEIISKKLEEREKEVKNFYKSESEPDDIDEDNDDDPRSENNQDKKITILSDIIIGNKLDLENKNVDNLTENSSDDNLNVNGSNICDIFMKQNKSEECSMETVAEDKNEAGDVDGLSATVNTGITETQNETITSTSNTDSQSKIPDKMTNINCTESPNEYIKDLTLSEIQDINTLTNNDFEESKDNSRTSDSEHMKPSSELYEFNLDDIDESSEALDEITENEELVEAEVKESSETKMISKLEVLQRINLDVQPRLSGGPNEIIDLAEGITKPNEITRLMERFSKHTMKKQIHKNKVRLNVVSVDGGQIHKETVSINVEEDERDPSSIEEKPGAKLARLRGDLQNQMAQRRSELWKQRLEKKSNEDEEKDIYDGEKSECGAVDDEDAILDDDEEEEMSESSDEGEDEAVEEVEKKSAFVDEEAEDIDLEDENYENLDENIDENNDDNQDVSEEESDTEEVEANSKQPAEQSPVKKVLKRIIQRFADDSDDEEDLPSTTVVNREKLQESQEDEITCHQPQKHVARSGSDMEFLTPVSYITGIQNLNNSASKISPFRVQNVPSPLKDTNWHSDLQKKLFQNSEISNTQAQTISDLCSGNMPDSQDIQESVPVVQTHNSSQDMCFEITCSVPPTTQDVLGICSGGFTGTSQIVDSSDGISKSPSSQVSATEISQKIPIENHTINPSNEVKSLDEDHGLMISQLLNEEEMENFKRKFDTPVMTATQRRIVEEFEEDIAAGGVIDSDDEDENLEVKKRKQKKLNFSDDESSDDNEAEKDEEEINLHDEVEDEEEDIPADNIGYDSEENEIEIDAKKKTTLKASDFFENEAELSESEWGSDDEDEKNLDRLEAELGDTEKFDEKKLKLDLEKIHMRRMLDDDNREVKLLQELLLEDGELHGTGRERQFKWKNIDSVDNVEGENAKEDDEIYLDEEESEEQWRKRRHEREMFLKEKLEKSQRFNDDDLLGNSQLLKIGHEVLRRSQKGSQSLVVEEKEKQTESPKWKSTFTLLNKRGSFLSRGEQVLQRLSSYNKVTDSVTIGAAKNSRNFLFQTISAGEETIKVQNKKRKGADGTPKVIKKLRLSDNLSPADRKKNEKPSAKSKLLWNSTD